MPKSNTSKISSWLFILLTLLLLLNVYQWYMNSQIESKNDKYEIELIEIEKVNAQLDEDYRNALSNLEEMRSDNKELNLLIDSQAKELTAQKDKINNLIWSKRELNKARTEMEKLNAQNLKFLDEIAQLNKANNVLTQDNTKLKNLNENLTKEKQLLETTTDNLSKENFTLTSTNEALSLKVNLANAIKINAVEIVGYKVNTNGIRKKRSRVKVINEIDVCVITEKNMVVDTGAQVFLVQVINPQGETLGNEDSGGGILINKSDKSSVKYTFQAHINYKNQETNACFVWKKPEDIILTSGVYNIHIYNNGYLVGMGSRKLK